MTARISLIPGRTRGHRPRLQLLGCASRVTSIPFCAKPEALKEGWLPDSQRADGQTGWLSRVAQTLKNHPSLNASQGGARPTFAFVLDSAVIDRACSWAGGAFSGFAFASEGGGIRNADFGCRSCGLIPYSAFRNPHSEFPSPGQLLHGNGRAILVGTGHDGVVNRVAPGSIFR